MLAQEFYRAALEDAQTSRFCIGANETKCFFPPLLAQGSSLLRVCARFDTIMNQIPVIRNVGGIYTLVASK